MSYSYRAYGLDIHSSSCIPGLRSTSVLPGDTSIQFEDGPEPTWVADLVKQPSQIITRRGERPETGDPAFLLTQYGPELELGYQLSYSDGTRFFLDGSATRVWGAFQAPLTREDLATYFLGPVMGFILRRRHINCLHASAVSWEGNCILFCGEAGSGKSTTAAALALRGVHVLAEDIVPLEESGGAFRAVPGYPRVCLWPESVNMLLGATENLPLLTPVWEKRYLELDGQRGKFADAKLPIGLIYLFSARRGDDSAPRSERLSPREALLELVKNTYMNWLLDREQRAMEFDTLCRLVRQVPVRRLVPHSGPEKITSLCELILQDARETFSVPEIHRPSGNP